MLIRSSRLSDIPVMQEIIAEARGKMRAAGNFLQWTDGYPSEEVLRDDIARGFSYVVEENGRPVATFVLAVCEEPTYRKIYGGQWLDDRLPYGTVHRIGSLEGVHGVLDEVLRWAFGQVGNIRIDTHRDNRVMRHLMEKHGFTYCGIIFLANGDERLAYQKLRPDISGNPDRNVNRK